MASIRDAKLLVERSRYTLLRWTAPFVVVAIVYKMPQRLDRLVALFIGVGIVVLASRLPVAAMTTLVLVLPLRDGLFAWLFKLGVPAAILRPAGFWKEALIAGVVIAAVSHARRQGWRLDRLDYLCLALIAIVVLYFIVPGIAGVTRPYDNRIRSLRVDAGFAVVFLAVRRIGRGARAAHIVGSALIVSGSILAATGLIQRFFPASWNTFMLRTIQWPSYSFTVLHVPSQYRLVEGIGRVGGILVDPPVLAEALVLPLAIVVSRMLRADVRPRLFVAAGTLIGGIIVTGSRGAALAALGAVILNLRRAPGITSSGRLRYGLALGAAIIVVAPFLGGTNLLHRAKSAAENTDPSAQIHSSQLQTSLRLLEHHPLGSGLGFGSSSATEKAYVSEDSYLQIGNEIGILAAGIFVALVVGVVLRLVRSPSTSEAVVGLSAAAISISIVAIYTHIWIDLNVAWPFWALAALVLPPTGAPPPTIPVHSATRDRAGSLPPLRTTA